MVRRCRSRTSSACLLLHRRHRQVGADPALRLAARRDGRPDAGLGAHPRRHHGHRRRLHGRAHALVFELAPVALAVVAIIGAVTALFAATIGIAQRDIKKVLAYSTISQLGFMFVGVGTRATSNGGIFHLVTHAFFKAGLFLGAGSVMHALSGEGDITRMGGLPRSCR